MQIIKCFNNNAALAVDGDGNQVIVLGKGIGFPRPPYELENLSLVERTFYDINPKHYRLLAEIPEAILAVSAEIVAEAGVSLDCILDSNFTFTLADHLNFAVQRLKNGIQLDMSLAYDVQHLYSKEYAVAKDALRKFRFATGIDLPEDEASFITMHLLTAKYEIGNLNTIANAASVIADVSRIVEDELHIKLDKDSYNYSRFAMHLRYLVQRLTEDRQAEDRKSDILESLISDNPDIYLCTCKVVDYFKDTWDFSCNSEETLYLMLHIHRIQGRNNAE